MITNQRQYRIAQAWIVRFERALAEFRASDEAGKMHPVRRKLREDSLCSQLEELREEVAEYERLSSGKVGALEVASLSGLATGLIQARIAAGLTQRQLAERLGMKEQQVQRYEASGYRSASLERIREVMDALGVTVEGRIVVRVV